MITHRRFICHPDARLMGSCVFVRSILSIRPNICSSAFAFCVISSVALKYDNVPGLPAN